MSTAHNVFRRAALSVIAVITLVLMFPGAAHANQKPPGGGGGGTGLKCRDDSGEVNGPSGRVNVSPGYCYDPTTNNHPAWHDYCTHSPDSYNGADFRGPCAYHDSCLEAGLGHGYCDGPLLSDLKHNCGFAHPGVGGTPDRLDCDAVAYGYYVAIKAYTAAT